MKITLRPWVKATVKGDAIAQHAMRHLRAETPELPRY
jgi:hypothetical protein